MLEEPQPVFSLSFQWWATSLDQRISKQGKYNQPVISEILMMWWVNKITKYVCKVVVFKLLTSTPPRVFPWSCSANLHWVSSWRRSFTEASCRPWWVSWTWNRLERGIYRRAATVILLYVVNKDNAFWIPPLFCFFFFNFFSVSSGTDDHFVRGSYT